MVKEAETMLSSAAAIIERARDQEEDCIDNIPESLQDTERYEQMENAASNLSEALEHIESAIELLGEAVR